MPLGTYKGIAWFPRILTVECWCSISYNITNTYVAKTDLSEGKIENVYALVISLGHLESFVNLHCTDV